MSLFSSNSRQIHRFVLIFTLLSLLCIHIQFAFPMFSFSLSSSIHSLLVPPVNCLLITPVVAQRAVRPVRASRGRRTQSTQLLAHLLAVSSQSHASLSLIRSSATRSRPGLFVAQSISTRCEIMLFSVFQNWLP